MRCLLVALLLAQVAAAAEPLPLKTLRLAAYDLGLQDNRVVRRLQSGDGEVALIREQVSGEDGEIEWQIRFEIKANNQPALSAKLKPGRLRLKVPLTVRGLFKMG